jgi:hypothetical protein
MMNAETEKPAAPPELTKDWRFYAGLSALILAGVMPLLALAVPFLDLSAAVATTVVGLLVAGGPEVLLLVAAALLGKEALRYFIDRAKRAVCSAAALAGRVAGGDPHRPGYQSTQASQGAREKHGPSGPPRSPSRVEVETTT